MIAVCQTESSAALIDAMCEPQAFIANLELLDLREGWLM